MFAQINLKMLESALTQSRHASPMKMSAKLKFDGVRSIKHIYGCGFYVITLKYLLGSTPYWDFGAPKQYYISKTCSTKKKCQAIRKKYMPYCTHIWYEDWSCSECCLGDRCNYYVISGGSSLLASLGALLSAFIVGRMI